MKSEITDKEVPVIYLEMSVCLAVRHRPPSGGAGVTAGSLSPLVDPVLAVAPRDIVVEDVVLVRHSIRHRLFPRPVTVVLAPVLATALVASSHSGAVHLPSKLYDLSSDSVCYSMGFGRAFMLRL
ncbi:hypothetical protein J6590_009063 [Homalodisca vitripennis]|nr:hypothetical protein J6590_009063 [Homalodisca vitripennis]